MQVSQVQALESGADRELMHVTIAVGGKAGLHYLPLTIAQQLGYFRDEGIAVEISDFAGGSKSIEALIGGSADMVCGGYEHVIRLQGKGQRLRAFAVIGLTPQVAIGVAVRHAARVNQARDLRGLRIGVPSPGSSSHHLLDVYLEKGGVKPTDVSIVGVGTGAGAIAALRNGEVDALANVEPIMTMLEQRDEIKIIADVRTRAGVEQLLGGQMPFAAMLTSEAFLRAHPRTVQAVANAVIRAERWVNAAGPAEIEATVPLAYQLGDRALYLASFESVRGGFSRDGLMPASGPANALRFFAVPGGDTDAARIRLDETFTNEFARRADARYRTPTSTGPDMADESLLIFPCDSHLGPHDRILYCFPRAPRSRRSCDPARWSVDHLRATGCARLAHREGPARAGRQTA
jgi:NitT/TauT family transport system substrate-binding protein